LPDSSAELSLDGLCLVLYGLLESVEGNNLDRLLAESLSVDGNSLERLLCEVSLCERDDDGLEGIFLLLFRLGSSLKSESQSLSVLENVIRPVFPFMAGDVRLH